MHAMVVRMRLDPGRRPEVIDHLQRDVAGWAMRQPGFVSGRWFCTTDGGDGLGVIVFDTQAAAAAAARGPRATPHDEASAWNIERVDLFEQVAAADMAEDAIF